MAQQTDRNIYREVAKFVQDTAGETLSAYSEISFPPVIGDLQYFPRATAEARAAERGFTLLREQFDEIIAILSALAMAADNNLPVPEVLRTTIEPYIRLYQPSGGGERNVMRAEKKPIQRRKPK